MASLARKMPAKLGIQYQAYSDDLISRKPLLFLQSTGWSGSNSPIVCKRGELQRARDGSQEKKKPI